MIENLDLETRNLNGAKADTVTKKSADQILARLRKLSEHHGRPGGNHSNTSDEKFGASSNFNYGSILQVRNINTGSPLKIWLLTIVRFHLILLTIIVFTISLITDKLLYWSKPKRQQKQAKRLHFILATILGGAMVKVGQQLSLRYDLLPVIYCEELSHMLDKVPPFKREKAIRIIEKQMGEKIEKVFVDDIALIGSASIACVYKSCLKDGSQVAIKVRRPGIVSRIVSDLNALGWMLGLIEFLNIVPYGNTKNLRKELRDILYEELNFRLEIRYQELFKKNFDQFDNLEVSAPKVYYQYSGEEVIVSEFIDGISVNDILKAIEHGEKSNLNRIAAFGINPKIIAKRIIKASFFGLFESPFFHGDPHPANILVLKNNRIIMIDFGACGVFSSKEMNSMHEMHYFYAKNDVGGMVRALVSLMEPLPPIDIDSFMQELEDKWWIEYFGIKSDHPLWWERTSMGLWLSLLTLVRKYRVPLPARMLRMVRATLLYDTVTARLYRKIDVFEEYHQYYLEKCHEAKWDLKKSMIQQMLLGPDDVQYKRIESLINLGEETLFKLQKFISRPIPNFGVFTDKIYDVLRIVFKWLINATIISLIAFGLAFILGERPQNLSWYKNFSLSQGEMGAREVILCVWFLMISVFSLSFGARIYRRFGDKDI